MLKIRAFTSFLTPTKIILESTYWNLMNIILLHSNGSWITEMHLRLMTVTFKLQTLILMISTNLKLMITLVTRNLLSVTRLFGSIHSLFVWWISLRMKIYWCLNTSRHSNGNRKSMEHSFTTTWNTWQWM